MKKIAIVTLNGYFNHGNRLQNLALQKTLEKMGFSVQTIRFNRKKKNQIILYNYIKNMKAFLSNPIKFNVQRKRYMKFLEFSREQIKETKDSFFINDDLSKLNDKFDYFIVGSDQVWNPFMNNLSSFFFLEFAHKEKRVAYAPSFGISELPKELIERYRHSLCQIPNLSVREIEGAQIIKETTGITADVLIDPTMLITKEEWMKLAKNPDKIPNQRYLLTYFLGNETSDQREHVSKMAKENELKIIDLGSMKSPNTYCIDPSEFIWYIENCKILCTDSFHGAVFSILFKKPFVVYERSGSKSMYSRIETLLEKFKIKNRKSTDLNEYNSVFDLDFITSDLVLEKERNLSLSFLKKSLGIESELGHEN